MPRHKADPDFFACRSCPGAALRRASRAVTQHYERCFRGSGLRATQFSLLAVLTQTGPLPVSRMAAQLGLERTTLTRNLRLLETSGFIQISSTEKDQRVRRVELTPAGYSAAKKGLLVWRKARAGLAPVLRVHNLEKFLIPSNL